jgi:hypothetical protein
MLKKLGKRCFEALGLKVSRQPKWLDPRIPNSIKAMWPVRTGFELIRAGGSGDGAYLIPDDLDGIAALFSPGVDKVAQFEADMAARGIPSYLADASVQKPPVENAMFKFDRKFLGLVDDGDMITIDTWVETNEPGTNDLMLQMDIEGAEWGVLANMSAQLLSRFRIMVVEFHSLSRMLDDFGAQVMTDVFNRLSLTHHVVHAHPNNYSGFTQRGSVQLPELIEVTYLRKDRAEAKDFVKEFPHPLDITNVVDRPTLTLPFCWHA